jgi:NMD protein affecting ribosome stability and mRNA decay
MMDDTWCMDCGSEEHLQFLRVNLTLCARCCVTRYGEVAATTLLGVDPEDLR